MKRFFSGLLASMALALCTPALAVPAGTQAPVAATPSVNAADVGFDVIMLAGQSNQVGNGASFDINIDTTDSRVFQWAASGSYIGQMVQAVDPLDHVGVLAGRVGAGMTLGKTYASAVLTNRRVLLVPCALTSTGFTTFLQGGSLGDWVSGTPGGPLYENCIALTNAAIASGNALGYHNRIALISWDQGEADASESQTTYAAQLDALIAGFRSRITGATATTPFIVTSMTPEYAVGATGVQAAHVDTPRRDYGTAFVQGAAGMTNPGDTTHFNAVQQRINGALVFNAISYANADVLGGPAPAAPTSLALGYTSTTTTLNFSWKPSAPGRTTDYVVQYKPCGGSYTNVDLGLAATSYSLTGLSQGACYTGTVYGSNETGAGTSATPISATTLTFPGVPTSLASGTATYTSIPITFTAPAGSAVTDYNYGYCTSPCAGGVYTPFVHTASTNTSPTISALSPATSYLIEVAAINQTVTGSFTSPITATTPSSPYLFDNLSVHPSHAYSVRKVAAGGTYSMQVRRTSDSTTANIGFVSNNLDTSTLATFCASTSCFLTTFYDQVGTANVTITTQSLQPRIYNAGTADTINSVVAPHFLGAQFLTSTTGFPTASDYSISVVGSASGTGQNFMGSTTGSPHTFWTNGSGKEELYQGGGFATASATFTYNTLTNILGTYANATKAGVIYSGGTSVGSGTAGFANTDAGITLGSINGGSGNSFLNGYIPEAIVFPGVVSSADIATIESSQHTAFGSP